MRALISQPFFQACRNHVGLNAWLSKSRFELNGEGIADDLDHLLAFNAFVERLTGVYQLRVVLRNDWVQVIGNGDLISISFSPNQTPSFLRVVDELEKLVQTAMQTESTFYSIDPVQKFYYAMYQDIPVLTEQMQKIRHPDFKPLLAGFIAGNYSLEAFFEFIVLVSRDVKLLKKIKALNSKTLNNLLLIYEYFLDILDHFGEEIENIHFEHISNIPIEFHSLNLKIYQPVNNLNGRIKAGAYAINWRESVVKTMNIDNIEVKLITK